MNKKIIGLDEWQLSGSPLSLVYQAKKQGWMIYDLNETSDGVHWYASVHHRSAISRSLHHATLLRTTGALGMFLRNLKRPSRMISLLLSVFLWVMFSESVFAIEIKGEKQVTKQLIQDTLVQLKVKPPLFHRDVEAFKQKLKKSLENDVAWLEVVKQGSRYLIYYTPKEFAQIDQLNRNELIAQKDAVIAGFDLQHGMKMFKRNDVVKKGDVLVSNILMDSASKPQELYVLGKVYGYTWNRVDISMKRSHLPLAMDFYQMLLEARFQVSRTFFVGDKIHKENILHFTKDTGTIRLSVLYTVYEDISTPR